VLSLVSYQERPRVEKVLEGYGVIAIAGTGAGKSLIFGMLAIAAEVAGFEGIVIVICPLKSLNIRYLGETVQQHAPSSVA